MLPGVRRRKAEGRRGRWASPASASFYILLVATVVAAQNSDKPYPIFTADHLDTTMTTLGPNVAGIRASLGAGDFATAKERAIRSREQLATTVTFWRDNRRDDALALLRTALNRLDALDAALSTDATDAAAVAVLTTEISDACAACHEIYREQEPVSGEYRLRSGALR